MKKHTKWEFAALAVIAAMTNITGESLPLESGEATAITEAADTSRIVHVSTTGTFSPAAYASGAVHVSVTGTVFPAPDASGAVHVSATGTVFPAPDASGTVHVSATGTVFPAPDASGAVHVSATGTVFAAADASAEASAPGDSSPQQVLVRMERHTVQPDPESVDIEEQLSDALDAASEPNKEKQ